MSASSTLVAGGATRSRVLTWAALGDSLTAGSRKGELTWASITARSLSSSDLELDLVCLAEPGATCSAVTDRQLEAAIAADPQIVSLICGANDVIGSVRPRVEVVASSLDGLWFSLRSALPAASMLTCTYPAHGPRNLGPRSRERIAAGLRELNAAIRLLAGRHRIACADLEGHPGVGDAANFAADGLHPSALGQLLMAGTIAPLIQPLIDEENPG
ncbi:MAG: SGNH/GDSL hydrolase family protein [Solirubrobacterales bacterium]